ncbi:type II restriction endonuclease subunit M [Salinicola halophilus]|uniref:type II restriction endonuclease subunit M n=1 Tax=Salinicola halophilus TaxID=184065 RepID=UPI000DA1C13A|nr:type II restriction endonuclease subunit M [Salinicola halophilus]
MSIFFRLVGEENKSNSLGEACRAVRIGGGGSNIFQADPDGFFDIPGTPFAYRASDRVRESFNDLVLFENDGRTVRQGLATTDDFRFVRCWWEVFEVGGFWFGFVKGGVFSHYYMDVTPVVNWAENGAEIKAEICRRYPYLNGNPDFVAKNSGSYFFPGLTWPLRGAVLSVQAVPEGCIFSVAGKMAFASLKDIGPLHAIMSSRAFTYFLRMLTDAVRIQFEAGLIQRVPIPNYEHRREEVSYLISSAWKKKRLLDTVVETSHAFLLPGALRGRLFDYDPPAIHAELADIQSQIDDIAFDLYSFSDEDRQAAQGDVELVEDVEEDNDNESQAEEAPPLDALLSWTAGVAFGRFDWRLVTGEREAPPDPEPFDPLPVKSPGMLRDDADPYHRHAGILVDDKGHEHDLPRLMADVLETVNAQVDEDLRRWLRRDFFKYHLQQYSKSRRKAPIYWPLATASGSYTLWVYYPDLTDQTLFTAVNDFVEPKLKQVDSELGNLRLAGASRSRADEKRLEELSDFRDELADLRDTLLRIAPGYKPNHDDGVQISAAPLWPLFRHRPWQNVLRDIWERLEQGDYDWAHLVMAYWPERVREKCITDKSLAIAHDLEYLYVEPEPKPKKARGRKKGTGSSE